MGPYWRRVVRVFVRLGVGCSQGSSRARVVLYIFIFSLPPFDFSPDQAKSQKLTPYGTRHLFNDISRACFWKVEYRQELGSWDPDAVDNDREDSSRSTTKKRKASVMANHYSRNVPALEAGCAIRVRLVQMIADFLADRDWRDVLPTTVTFSSLPQARPTHDLLSEDPLPSSTPFAASRRPLSVTQALPRAVPFRDL